MASLTETQTKLHFLKDLWDDSAAAGLDEADLLRYRSNLLGADFASPTLPAATPARKSTRSTRSLAKSAR